MDWRCVAKVVECRFVSKKPKIQTPVPSKNKKKEKEVLKYPRVITYCGDGIYVYFHDVCN
jgi:hypothetical protein